MADGGGHPLAEHCHNVTLPLSLCDMTTLSPAGAIRAAPEKSFVHVDRLPGTSAAARKAASRAAANGELVAVRRGLYYRGKRTRYGMTTPRVEEIARAVLGTRGVGPAGYSAARSWGVTTQVPPVWHVATLRSVERIEGAKQHARRNLARADLNEKEIALLMRRASDRRVVGLAMRSSDAVHRNGWYTGSVPPQ